MKAGGQTTEVRIYGTVYSLRSEHDPADLQRLAKRVDETMRALAPDPAAADSVKVAVLAAMNLADEAERTRRTNEGQEERIDAAAKRLNALIAAAPDDAEVPERAATRRLDGAAATT